MNRWSRIVLALGVASFLGWLGTGALGFRVADEGTLVEHTLLGFVALLAIVLTQSWIAVFALVSVRLVGRRAAAEEADAAAVPRSLRRARAVAVGGALVAIAAASVQFTVSNALYPGRLEPRAHLWAAVASAVAVALALAAEAWALARHGRAIAEIQR